MAKPATKKPDTALAAALADAGYVPPKDRLAAIADQIFAEPFRTRDAMHQAVIRKIVGDADLLWALLERYANAAIEVLLTEAMMRARAKREAAKSSATSSSSGATSGMNITEPPSQMAGGSRGKAAAAAGFTSDEKLASQVAVNEVVARVITKLDTFKINGRPIGDCTPEEILAWCASQKRNVRFAWLIANSGVPHGHRVREYLTNPEEIEAFYVRAQGEMSNE